MMLLAGDARAAVERVLHAVSFAERLRSTRPSATLGTWLNRFG